MTADELLDIAHSAAPPPHLDPGTFEEITFDTPSGWKVVIFYDGGDLDYIDSMIAPDGAVIDPWKRPTGDQLRLLTYWRGVNDTERLKGLRISEDGFAYDPKTEAPPRSE